MKHKTSTFIIVVILSASMGALGASAFARYRVTHSTPRKSPTLIPTPSASSTATENIEVELTVDEVLRWREQYEDLLGAGSLVAQYELGTPTSQTDRELKWSTQGGRKVVAILKDGKVYMFRIIPRDNERLSIMQVLRRAELYKLDSDTWTNNTGSVIRAKLKGAPATLLFSVTPNADPEFESVLFYPRP